MKRKFMQVFAFIMAFILFISCPLSVYASEKWEGSLGLTLYYNKDKILQYFKDTGEFWLYGASQLGAIVKSDFVSFAENKKKMDDILSEGNKVGVYVDENDNAKGMFFSKEFMAELKALIEQYAKENEPYTMYRTVPLTSIPYTAFNNQGNVYQSLKNLLADSSSGVVGVSFVLADGKFTFTDIGSHFKDVGLVKHYYDGLGYKAEVKAYEISTWKHATYPRYRFTMSADDAAIKDKEDFIERATETFTSYSEYIRFICLHDDVSIQSIDMNVLVTGNQVVNVLVSSDSRRIRVYNTYADFQDYTLGKRKVYYTSNYYNYVPEDLSVTIDDLQKTVDDLSKVIDELLKQIQDNTDESEIEELLRQILEALKNQQGGGGGTGGGDVNVDIDLSTTNGLLSKILAKVTQIFDKMSSSAGQTMDSVVTAIEDLGKMLKRQLGIISGDLDDIKDKLDVISEQEFTEKTDSFFDSTEESFSEISEVAKNKFPLSVPNDLKNIISVFTKKPPEPETEAYSVKGNTLYGMSTGDSEIIMIMEGSETYSSGWSDTGAPVFNLPIVLESLGWDYAIVVDLSNFGSIAKLCRTYMTLVYIWALLMLTIKVIGLWGELVD